MIPFVFHVKHFSLLSNDRNKKIKISKSSKVSSTKFPFLKYYNAYTTLYPLIFPSQSLLM